MLCFMTNHLFSLKKIVCVHDEKIIERVVSTFVALPPYTRSLFGNLRNTPRLH